MSENAATHGRFPKFLDTNDDWKLLIKGDTPETSIYFRIVEEDRKKIDLSIKAGKREIAVGRNIRSVLDEKQNKFGLQNAGVSMHGGPMPFYTPDADGKASDTIEAYVQNYRYTKRIV